MRKTKKTIPPLDIESRLLRHADLIGQQGHDITEGVMIDAANEIRRLRAALTSARNEALEEAAALMETETASPEEYNEFPSVVKMVRKAGQKDRAERIRTLKTTTSNA